MLKINPEPHFTEDIEITIPGKKETGSINLTFKYRTREELKAFWGGKEKKTDKGLIMGIVTAWDGMDADFNEKNVEIFLNNYPMAGFEIMTAYQKLLLESRVKN